MSVRWSLLIVLLLSACAMPLGSPRRQSNEATSKTLRPNTETCAQWAERRVTNELEQANAYAGLRLDGESYEASTRRWDAAKRIRALTLQCQKMKKQTPK